jgi:hypothetical protein
MKESAFANQNIYVTKNVFIKIVQMVAKTYVNCQSIIKRLIYVKAMSINA